ncbi:Ubiquitin carboxyl-terminal hydrolase 45 [Varanus komodoensis]|nr:Ubiquitin carboxyl-terminal hydrolase 45 [Varanus komodoensis]
MKGLVQVFEFQSLARAIRSFAKGTVDRKNCRARNGLLRPPGGEDRLLLASTRRSRHGGPSLATRRGRAGTAEGGQGSGLAEARLPLPLPVPPPLSAAAPACCLSRAKQSPSAMRVKDPATVIPDKTKRHKKSNQHQDEDSSDDIAGLTCQHVSQAVDVHHVKRAVAQNVWSICSECLKERRIRDGEPVMPSDVWLCLKCGTQGCSQNSEGQHSLKHFQTARAEPHCIVINLSTWIVWCYECNEELSTHCNKKALAQVVDFLQRHVNRNDSSSTSKIIWLHEERNEASDILKGKGISSSWASIPVKGINNLGNTCFFNAVMQNLAQTHMLNELMYDMKEKGTKLKIGQSPASQLDPLVVNLASPGSLTSAMFLFLHSMKETGKGPLSPKVLFSQLCQKAPRFKGFQQQDSQEVLHYLLDAMRIEETKRIQAAILKAFNNPTTKTADEETKRKVKAYGREGVKMNFIDRIFVGELTSTIMCEECENVGILEFIFLMRKVT